VSSIQRDLIFDVGLHRGEDSAFYLAKGYRVVAFEADPDLASAARIQFARPIAEGRFTLVEGAILAPGGEPYIVFYKNPNRTTWGTVDAERAATNARLGKRSVAVKVKRVDLAHCLAIHGVPYYAKTDIEGADSIALAAILGQESKPPFLSWESDKLSLDAVASELDQARAAGYSEFQIVQQMFVPGRRVRVSTLSGDQIEHRFADGASGPFGEDLQGSWVNRDEALQHYARIFREYARWGDASVMRRIFTEKVLDRVSRLTRHALPGWYDTHARWTG
jgi:FkbM family methyltransferase